MNGAARRRLGLAFGWAATTALAVVLALAAVGAVSDSVTESRPKPLSAAAISEALAEGTAPEGQAPAATTEPPRDPPPTSSTTRPPSATVPPTTRGTSPAPTIRPSQPAPTTPASTAPVPSTSATTVPRGDVPAGPEERTYEQVGGTVRVRFTEGQAELLAATPNAGFRVERTSGNPAEVRVTFRGEDHESRFRAWWDDGPREQIEEKER